MLSYGLQGCYPVVQYHRVLYVLSPLFAAGNNANQLVP